MIEKPKLPHVALFVPSLAGGGAERVTINLAAALVNLGTKVDLVLGQAEGAYLNEVPGGVSLVNLGCGRMIRSVPPLVRYLRRARPQALISALDHCNTMALIAGALSRMPVKTIVVTHIHLSSWLAQLRPVKRFVLKHLICQTYPRAHAMVTVSNGVAQDAARLLGLPQARFQVIYNPVVSKELATRFLEPISHRWLTPPEKPIVLAVGRLTEQKDFATLIRAFALLRKSHDARLIILGEGHLRDDLRQLTERLELSACVDMPGFVTNPYGYMSRASVLALSSRWEALPTVLIEAMSCGTPVVSTDCPSGPQEVLAGGKHGRLVPVGDHKALASALGDALEGRVVKPGPESWGRYLFEVAAKNYLALLDHPSR